jgi:hypothetical protein
MELKLSSLVPYAVAPSVKVIMGSGNIMWHVDPLLGNDRETNNYTSAVTR